MAEEKEKKLICGIVMPISPIDGCDERHWVEVQTILSESIELAGFEANLVSNSDDVGIIQKRIIQNLYDNPVVVCDVSGKNPNVMFELGIRLAFDKPTIIVKDDRTAYSFDTSPIEHLEYPRDLRFGRIVEYKERLADKIKMTYEKSISDSSYTTFLKHFGEFKIAKIEKKEVSGQDYILDELKEIRAALANLQGNGLTRRRAISTSTSSSSTGNLSPIVVNLTDDADPFTLNNSIENLRSLHGVKSVQVDMSGNPTRLFILLDRDSLRKENLDIVEMLCKRIAGKEERASIAGGDKENSND